MEKVIILDLCAWNEKRKGTIFAEAENKVNTYLKEGWSVKSITPVGSAGDIVYYVALAIVVLQKTDVK